MQYSLVRLAVLASGLAGSFIGGGDIAHAQMFIRSCSLGCSGGTPGSQIFCSLVEVHENEVLEVEFSLPIDPASLSVNSFRVVDVDNGTTPSGVLRVSPMDPNVLLFEAVVTPGPFGGLNFSMQPNRTYEIQIDGVNQGDAGPFIRSATGEPTLGRMLCSVVTNQGLLPLARPECVTTPNSVGLGALMSATGTTSVVLNDLEFQVVGLPVNSSGILIAGLGRGFEPLGAGSLCIGGALTRQGLSQSNAAGEVRWAIDVNGFGSGLTIAPGSTWRFQHVYRDVQQGAPIFTTSDALRVTFF